MARSEEKASEKAARMDSTLCRVGRPTTAEAVSIWEREGGRGREREGEEIKLTAIGSTRVSYFHEGKFSKHCQMCS